MSVSRPTDRVEPDATLGLELPVDRLSEADWAVCAQLRHVAEIVDGLWNEALGSPGDPESFRLGEASAGLHRALIALDDYCRRGSSAQPEVADYHTEPHFT